jgi:hypothetical protein
VGSAYSGAVNPILKYTLARLGLFVVVGGVLLALRLPIQPLLTLMIALLVSAVLSWVLLRKMRDQVAVAMADRALVRAEEKERLRSALAGEDADGTPGADGTSDNTPDKEPELGKVEAAPTRVVLTKTETDLT